MSFRDQLKACREACGLTRAALAEQLGVSASAVGNYETGVSFPKEDVLLRLFDALRTDPNQLFCGSYRSGGFDLSGAERTLLENGFRLFPAGLSAEGVRLDLVKIAAQRALSLQLAADAAP